MGFFKKHSGTTSARLVRIERLVWILIYGGLLAIVLGMFVAKGDVQNADVFYAAGGIAVLVGVVMIYLRSRMHEET
ncbi:MAG: hypothetical protein KGN32_00625 [Burkholderiales bacterium]|nr:hypothetical protein [Burkholderiales bacterium]